MSFTNFEIAEINKVTQSFPQGTELSVAKIVNKVPFYYGAFNSTAGVEQKSNSDSVFEIGSITKVFTAYLLAELVVDGVIEIDDSINSILPFPIKGNTKITFRELVTHTSGLPRIPPGIIWQVLFISRNNTYKNYTEEKLLNYLKNNLKVSSKGEVLYSNLGVGILGYTLSLLSGYSYNELLTKKLFSSLGMFNSSVVREKINTRLVQGINTKGKPMNNWDLGALESAGAVLSSTEDLVKFALANFDSSNEVMNYQRKTAFENDTGCFALGWFIFDKPDKGERMYFHNGGTGGYSSAMLIDTKSSNAFIVLSNISCMHKFTEQRAGVDKLVLNLMTNLVSTTS